MVELEHIQIEMEKVRVASLGEVILFAGPDMFHTHVFPRDRPVFKAGLCIYAGISEGQYVEIKGKNVKNVLNPNHNIELAVIESEGVHCALVRPSFVTNQMALGLKDNVYIGPKEISDVLRTAGEGYFDKFFQEYVAKYRMLRGE
ncbi:MAG: hypothetical protein WC402_00350 [Candidatus Pacearchaeota archaeon]|jgi:hypothetical protein